MLDKNENTLRSWGEQRIADMVMLFQKEWALLLVIVLFAFLLRLKGISNSVTDWHAFRQADTASVTREFVKQGIDLLRPKYHDHSNIQSGKDNPIGYRMVEFPFLNAFIAVIVQFSPQFDLVFVSRFVSVVFSLGTVVALYVIGKMWSGRAVGYLAAFIFAVLPYAVFYSRVVLPEPAFVFFLCGSVATLQIWLNTSKKSQWYWFFASAVSLALAMLLKPYAVFFAPVYLVMLWQKYRFKLFLHVEFIVYGAIAVLPLLLWRKWILQFPAGIPASDWLFNGDGIRLRPAWFRWLFWERFTKLILGWFGVFFVATSVLRREKAWLLYFAWWISILGYFVVIATGNVRHDYYQVITLPILCLSFARGILWFWEQRTRLKFLKHQSNKDVFAFVIIAVLFSLSLFWADRQVRGYYSTRPDWEIAGQAADRILPKDALVIAPAFGDTAFLFQTNRTGWPIGFEIEDKISKGAQYYVTTSYDDEARALEKNYPTVAKTKDYLILKLERKP